MADKGAAGGGGRAFPNSFAEIASETMERVRNMGLLNKAVASEAYRIHNRRSSHDKGRINPLRELTSKTAKLYWTNSF